jgi:hypothetical protein
VRRTSRCSRRPPPLLDQAIVRWAAATGDAATADRLRHVQVRIADLSNNALGLEAGDVIWIDVNAAGHGWYLDPTPADDDEFGVGVDGFEWHAAASSPAADRVDLLTVLEHELGHVLGLRDNSGSDLMAAALGLGVRRLPDAGS